MKDNNGPNEVALEYIRIFVFDDCLKIFQASKSQNIELGRIASDAMMDLLCIRYHREAIRNVPGYNLTYQELIEKV
jgi:hypothetical protein